MRRILLAVTATLALGGVAAAKGPEADARYLVVMGAVTQPDGSQGALAAEVRRMFLDRLKRRADVTMQEPVWFSALAPDADAQLVRHRLRAYEASVKVISVVADLEPLPTDPTRGLLSVTARLRLFGSTLTDHVLKIGADGEASTSVLVTLAGAETARVKLTREVIDAALQEAIEATVTKIQLVAARERSSR